MLCYVMLCYVMLCYVMLCYVILCYVNIILVCICESYSLILSFNAFLKPSMLCFKLTNMHVRCVQVLNAGM